jgi:hypothetical protein
MASRRLQIGRRCVQLLAGNRRAAQASARGPWPCSLGDRRSADWILVYPEREAIGISRWHSKGLNLLSLSKMHRLNDETRDQDYSAGA